MPTSLDANQLRRIESVHRGYLYQHLYAVSCLFLAQRAGATTVIVERDEDIEIVLPDRLLYVQIKTRSNPLTWSDIESSMKRFDALREQHSTGNRRGSAVFVVAANIGVGPALQKRIKESGWPQDVFIYWPDGKIPIEKSLPKPQPSIDASLSQCASLAKTLPYAMLTPETLVWKLAGVIMAAAAGNQPRSAHAFKTAELPDLFEQLVVQLHDFPSPPDTYRSHAHEPSLQSSERIRIICGYSGAGKTSWISQAAMHAIKTTVYFDVTKTPGTKLAATIARELAARLFGRTGGGLGEVLLPGATGPEILHAIGARLAQSGEVATIVLDNANRVPPIDVQTLLQQGSHFDFILLCQPDRNMREMEALLGVAAESLQGWATDTVAQEVTARNCRGDYAACRRLKILTAGMPLYVQNAVAIAAEEYGGSIRWFCDEFESLTHIAETTQELLLSRVFGSLESINRDGIAVLSHCDIPLEQSDAMLLLRTVLGLKKQAAATLIRELRTISSIEVYSGRRIKVHDAMRLLGQNHLRNLGADTVQKTQLALKDILITSLEKRWDLSKMSLYLRMLKETGDVKTLAQFASDELFHELGVQPDIMEFLSTAAGSVTTRPEERFWALDGLAFADLKRGDNGKAFERLGTMESLISENNLGMDERLALGMKRMNLQAVEGDTDSVGALVSEIEELLPELPQYQRIFRYNTAYAQFSLGKYDATIDALEELIEEYYVLLGIGPQDVLLRNPEEIWPLVKRIGDPTDHLKHLADCLALLAMATEATKHIAPFARMHAMKFYQLANAFDSLFRVGQDLVDEFLARHDFIGARDIIENNLLPNVQQLKLLDQIVPIRSQYAVVLAYCGDFDSADAEIKRLGHYEAGLSEKGQWELCNQRKLVAKIRRKGPPPQWIPPTPSPPIVRRQKIGRNAPCVCGSGKKYKKCHGRTA